MTSYSKLKIKPGCSEAIDGLRAELNYAAEMIEVAKHLADRAKDSPEALAKVVKIMECCMEALNAIYRSSVYTGSLREMVAHSCVDRVSEMVAHEMEEKNKTKH